MEFYTWILAFHVMSFVSWMAMLFYLPRLFIYHRENADNKSFTDIVEIQEYKLFKIYRSACNVGDRIFRFSNDLFKCKVFFQAVGWMHAKLGFGDIFDSLSCFAGKYT